MQSSSLRARARQLTPSLRPALLHCLSFSVYMRAFGGEAAGAASLAPKVGPLGLAAKKVADDIAKATLNFKGLRVTVKLEVKNRVATISIVPSAASLIVKALAEPERDRKKEKNVKHNGNVTMDNIYDIARTMRPRSMAKTFQGTVLEMLGSAVSVGCTVDGQNPKDIQQQIKSGSFVVPNE